MVGPIAKETTPDERASLLPFVESLKGNKGFEPHRPFIRVTPKGLFVAEKLVSEVLRCYQAWIAAASNGVAQKSIEKCRQRLFDGEEPERQYLIEGKNVLTGFLIPLPIKIPQQYGVPFYLGSLLPTSNYLHPADPLLQAIKGLELKHEKGGIEAHVARRDKSLIIPELIIRNFAQQAKYSRYLQRLFPDITHSLSTSLRVLVGLARRSRALPKGYPIVVPADVHKSRTNSVRMSGKFLLIEERGRVLRILELNGRNLSGFLRDELRTSPKQHLGSLRLTPKERDLLGYYESNRQRTSIHSRAFAEFSDSLRRTRDPRERFSGWFTAGECFERFASFFQLSQPIEKRKIEVVLNSFGITGHSYRMHGGWIFVMSRDGVVLRAIAKHIRLPGQRRQKG
jgi:hypothetical protein